MSEIELLYKNAHIEKVINHECTYDYGITCPNDNDTCENCGYYKEEEPDYPPFTAKKQLELIKWLSKISDISNINIECENKKICIHNILGQSDDCDTIEDALASYINDIWQDLTESEREQIAEILRG